MLKFEMLKSLKISFLFITSFLVASEPTLAVLENIVSNDTQKFSIGKYNFYCKPYGVVTLNELYANTTLGSTCKKSIETFYTKNPDLKYYSFNYLKIKQMYHIEFKKDRCIVFVQGQKNLSELLLESGLALQKPFFKDKEYGALLKNSQKRARMLRKGMWSENILRECIVELYK